MHCYPGREIGCMRQSAPYPTPLQGAFCLASLKPVILRNEYKVSRFFFTTAFHGEELIEWSNRAALLNQWRVLADKVSHLHFLIGNQEIHWLVTVLRSRGVHIRRRRQVPGPDRDDDPDLLAVGAVHLHLNVRRRSALYLASSDAIRRHAEHPQHQHWSASNSASSTDRDRLSV